MKVLNIVSCYKYLTIDREKGICYQLEFGKKNFDYAGQGFGQT